MKSQDDATKQTESSTIQPGAQVARYSPGQEKLSSSTDESIDVFSVPTPTTETLLKEKKSHSYVIWILCILIFLVIGAGVYIFLMN